MNKVNRSLSENNLSSAAGGFVENFIVYDNGVGQVGVTYNNNDLDEVRAAKKTLLESLAKLQIRERSLTPASQYSGPAGPQVADFSGYMVDDDGYLMDPDAGNFGRHNHY